MNPRVILMGSIVWLSVIPSWAAPVPTPVRAAASGQTESVYATCVKQLPKTLELAHGAPETLRFLVPKKDYWQDYESLIAGAGWGASVKYHNTSCEVVVYAYNKQQDSLTAADAEAERNAFDGFKPESVFEKEVGDFVFYGAAGLAPLDTSDSQVQMVSIAAVHNTFVKYRTVCRHLTDLSADANYRIADMMTSQVMKETLLPLDNCLTAPERKAK